eukprot:SAG31_NODE_6464_length_2007_cov_1.645702_1_plen_230_part_00
MGELVVRMQSGDALYMPAYWGHQTFSGLAAPTVSLACWFFPVAVDPTSRPGRNANSERDLRQIKPRREAAFRRLGASSPGIQWTGLRTLIQTLADKMAGKVLQPVDNDAVQSGSTLLRRWVEQRWRPQFGGLGLQPTASPPAALCEAASDEVTRAADKAADEIIASLDAMAGWHLPEHRRPILEYETCNVFDEIINTLPAFSRELAEAGVEQNQISSLLSSARGDCSRS